MTEPYNMTQAQRDAAHIAALEKQLQDMTAVIKALCSNTTHVHFRFDFGNQLQGDAVLAAEHVREAAGREAACFIMQELGDRRDLYTRLSQYEQWFYAKSNYTTRLDALRSTMTVARP